jgi:hypothetical protein
MPPMATPDIHNMKGVATSEEIIQLSLLYVGKIVAYIARNGKERYMCKEWYAVSSKILGLE